MGKPNLFIAVPLLLACCVPAVTQPPAGRQFDGIYAGEDTLVSGVVFQCGEPSRALEISILGGQFAYPFLVSPPRVAQLPVQIAADGTLAGQMQYSTGEDIPQLSRDRIDWVYLRGRVTGRVLDAMMTDMRCARRLMLRRQ